MGHNGFAKTGFQGLKGHQGQRLRTNTEWYHSGLLCIQTTKVYPDSGKRYAKQISGLDWNYEAFRLA